MREGNRGGSGEGGYEAEAQGEREIGDVRFADEGIGLGVSSISMIGRRDCFSSLSTSTCLMPGNAWPSNGMFCTCFLTGMQS